MTIEFETKKRCDHKFVGSKHCLKCGWRPFCGDVKPSHAGCCAPDPNASGGAPIKWVLTAERVDNNADNRDATPEDLALAGFVPASPPAAPSEQALDDVWAVVNSIGAIKVVEIQRWRAEGFVTNEHERLVRYAPAPARALHSVDPSLGPAEPVARDPYAAIRKDFAIAWDNTHPDTAAGCAISRIGRIITIPEDFAAAEPVAREAVYPEWQSPDPKVDGQYLAHNGSSYFVGTFERREWWRMGSLGLQRCLVARWMPLPPAPVEKASKP